ncbi:MAG TPA: alanine--tRNA ligase-related protein [Patescibacteria group bacterium]|nr:alanine--tRNA ligase-related protein [Patescibacteria group bacterium]
MSTKTHQDVRHLFENFWQKNKHSYISPVFLVPKEDATTLFTSSGMQPLIRYLSGAPHPQGKRLYNIQPCFRAVDIDEVGDNRHTTFFEMMGNWSLGDYFKKEQLEWVWEFFTKKLGLPKEKLYVTVFEGDKSVPQDEESYAVWRKLGVSENHIRSYGVEKNWWSRAGIPDAMPEGEIGGTDCEIFYEFDTPHDKRFGTDCHPNCDCGRFLEIGNSVFIQYRKKKDGILEELPQKNVDFGGGLERILAALNNDPDVFKTDVFDGIITEIEKDTRQSYTNERNTSHMRVIADHLKASVFLINDGVVPSNKAQGYVLRRLLRRSAVKMYQLGGGLTSHFNSICDRGVLSTYDGMNGIERNRQRNVIFSVIDEEINRFSSSLDTGLKIFKKEKTINGTIAFDLYQNYGFPFEITQELAVQRGERVSREEFDVEFAKHKALSRTASRGMFTGGLADH